MNEDTKHYYKMAPCPSYDIELMEGWLEHMAAKGFFLTGYGFRFGFGIFLKKEPKAVKYRLEASPKRLSFINDNGAAPPEDSLLLYEEYGWKYIAHRDDFFIYRNEQTEAREINTDPAVQALTLNVMRRNQGETLFIALMCLITVIISMRGMAFIVLVGYGTGKSFVFLICAVWLAAASVIKIYRLEKLRKKLILGENLEHRGEYGENNVPYCIGKVITMAAKACMISLAAVMFFGSFVFKPTMDISEYPGEIPFALAKDFTETIEGVSFETNSDSVYFEDDFLLPIRMNLSQKGNFTRAGEEIPFSYTVDYYETSEGWFARGIAKDLLRWKKDTIKTEVDFPLIEADFIRAYTYKNYKSNNEVQILVICKGEKAGLFVMYQPADDVVIPFESWAQSVAKSLD
ncbi:MAG: DUF2812 domain-containing protein [Eubacteriaceae bacterium]|nr:DUF2812 domain-containing protein [Eubacteriaceae bacterium]